MTTQPISIFICGHCPDKAWRDIGHAQGHAVRHQGHVSPRILGCADGAGQSAPGAAGGDSLTRWNPATTPTSMDSGAELTIPEGGDHGSE